jgi:hypothetical protein
MSYRFGVFLIVIGLILLIIFGVTLQEGETSYLFCGGAAFCLVFGIFLAIRFRPPSEPVQRFRTVNKFRRSTPKDKSQ